MYMEKECFAPSVSSSYLKEISWCVMFSPFSLATYRFVLFFLIEHALCNNEKFSFQNRAIIIHFDFDVYILFNLAVASHRLT